MTNLQNALPQIEQEFKANFPNANFATVLDIQKYNQISGFIGGKFAGLIPEDADESFFANLLPNLAASSPTLYSFAKASCIIDAISYKNTYSINGGEKQLDEGIIGINQPKYDTYSVSVDYGSGESLKVSDKSTAAEWQAYLESSFTVCAKQFHITSSFDAEIEQFKTEIPGKILASLETSVHSEL